jgi:hypothetical protein
MMDRVLVVAAALLVGTATHAQPNKEQYELQERCGKWTAEVFAKDWDTEVSNTELGQTIRNYENHYNSRLNKCIYLEITNTRGKAPSRRMRLVDLNENREIATYREVGPWVLCSVQEKECETEDEWRTLIKPFMED